ncbi:hypothetical protein ACP70R_042574 [Stipagrostis hirtigluma subsp. patula]
MQKQTLSIDMIRDNTKKDENIKAIPVDKDFLPERRPVDKDNRKL